MKNELIVKELLLQNIKLLEENETLYDFGEMWMQELLELSVLLGFDNIYKQALVLLARLKFGDPSKYDLGNLPKYTEEQIEKNELNVKRQLSIKPVISVVRLKYPENNLSRFEANVDVYFKDVEELKYAMNGDFKSAIEKAYHPEFGLNEQHLELIISYLFLTSNFNKGREIMDQLVTKDWSIQHLKRVELVERSKTQEWATLEASFNEIYPTRISIWENFLYIKGFAGLEPYDIYPWSEAWEFH